MLCRCVYIHSPLPNTQFFNHNAYAKNSKRHKDFIPDLLSTLFVVWQCRWHWFWRRRQPFEQIWQWRRALIERNGSFEYYHCLQLADTLKYILKDIFMCTIKEQCSDKGKRTWRGWNNCQNTVIDILCQSKWLHNADRPVAKWLSTERQRFFVLYVRLLKCDLVVVIYNHCIGHLYRQKRMLHSPCPILTMSINRATMIFGLASWVI